MKGLENQTGFLNALLDNALFVFDFDVTAGIIDKDVINADGLDYGKTLGITVPYEFDEAVRRVFSKDYLGMEYAGDSYVRDISCASLLKAFENGQKRVETLIYDSNKEEFCRVTYLLNENEENKHVMAYVCGQNITAIESNRYGRFEEFQRSLFETNRITANAGIGIWHIYLYDGEKPRMKANSKMRELLAVKDENISGEDLYDQWFKNVKPSYVPAVLGAVDRMIKNGKGEITYRWVHPDKGEIYVRCGGNAEYVEGKGYRLSGYHSDVTYIVESENKHRKELNQAYMETKKQKELLQAALDDYKQADYDRRTDFLTGLGNRQDMYELLNDKLSGKREKISAMFMMDIDNFKSLNDRYGHVKGDECLVGIGKALIQYGAENNLLFYRYGGEEILGIAFGTEKDSTKIADEILVLIRELNIQRSDVESGRVTVSIGYVDGTGDYEKMIDMADTAMYRAKTQGKDRAQAFVQEK